MLKKSKSSAISSYFAESVAIITAKYREKENGMPATWVIPVSFSPPLLAVSVSPKRYTHRMIRNSGVFGVNLLSDAQTSLSKSMGACTGAKKDKLSLPGADVFYGELGVPLLRNSIASIECRLVDERPEGDHTLFVGEVVNSYVNDANLPPLLYFRESYYSLGRFLSGY